MEQRHPFDANAFRLDPGRRLLEASAGTGKTFALAHLVLRLVAEKGLGLRELLVVTFTDAAAAELRDRIGRRLQQGLQALETPAATGADAVLTDWCRRVLADPALPAERLRGRLLLALEDLDAADITTIHGFAQRSLRRQALEAGQAPDPVLDTDPAALVAQVVHDYWLQQVLVLPPAWLAGLQQAGVSPAALQSLLLQLDGDPALDLDPLPQELPPDTPLPQGLPRLWQRLWTTFGDAWNHEGKDLQAALFEQAKDWKGQFGISSETYRPSARKDRVGEVGTLIAAAGASPPDYAAVRAVGPLRDYFHPGAFAAAARKIEGQERPIRLPRPAVMEAIGALVDGPAEAVLGHACAWGQAELQRRRARAGTLSYADLLAGLDPGADAETPTPLLQAVGERYRVALIDEFQDTDPVQWRVLRLAFGGPQHLLVMVGDPKQAIYRFRGGDISTYRQARDACADCWELRQNRRSTPALIDALNRLTAAPPGSWGLPRSRLEVPAVEAKADRHGPAGPALELLWLGGDRPAGGKLPSRTGLEQRLPDRVAAHVLALLRRGVELVEGGRRRALAPEDICVLVSQHRQAERLREALQRLGLPSRLVNQGDVFRTPAATALQRFLDALADPADGGRLRLLAASPLLGWSAEELATAPPQRWSELAGRLDQLRRALPRQGLLGVLSELLGSRSLARLARSGRLRADLQQVAELVQRRLHGDQIGAEGAADWLRRLRLEERRATGVDDDHQRHSDREDGCVALVTVHASKGLEYPVVICPYLWMSPDRRSSTGLRWQPSPAAGPVLDLHRDLRWGRGWQADQQTQAAGREEAERLAYVAVTRACHLLVLAWGPASGQQTAPLLPWLFPQRRLDDDGDPLAEHADDDWLAALEAAAGDRGLELRLIGEEPRPEPWVDTAAAAELQLGPVPERPLDRRWGRASYTAWTQGHQGAAAPAALDEGRDTSDPDPGAGDADGDASGGAARELQEAADWPADGPLAPLPRGAAIGDALHRILERIDYDRPLQEAANRTLAAALLREAGLADPPVEAVLAGLEQMLATPCGGALADVRLGRLPRSRRLNELSFDLSLRQARAADLAAAFRRHPGGTFNAAYADRLASLAIDSRGYLTGSIDLVFTATDADGEERWWVADWKSNWLGRRDENGRPVACGPRHYGPAAMAALMEEKHYPLQAHLYLVALHRYLGWRLPGYRPERHLGGYVYVFLRGTPGPAGERALPGPVPGMLVDRPPVGRVLALDQALGVAPPDADGVGR